LVSLSLVLFLLSLYLSEFTDHEHIAEGVKKKKEGEVLLLLLPLHEKRIEETKKHYFSFTFLIALFPCY